MVISEKVTIKGTITKEKAYWISPDGKVIPVKLKHVDVVNSNPSKFKLTLDKIKSVYKKHKEPFGHEGYARDEIMTDLVKREWIRLRYYDRYDTWTVQIYKLSKAADVIAAFAVALKKKKLYEYSTFKVIDLNGTVLAEVDIDEILEGALHKKAKQTYQSPFAAFREMVELHFLKSIDEYKVSWKGYIKENFND